MKKIYAILISACLFNPLSAHAAPCEVLEAKCLEKDDRQLGNTTQINFFYLKSLSLCTSLNYEEEKKKCKKMSPTASLRVNHMPPEWKQCTKYKELNYCGAK